MFNVVGQSKPRYSPTPRQKKRLSCGWVTKLKRNLARLLAGLSSACTMWPKTALLQSLLSKPSTVPCTASVISSTSIAQRHTNVSRQTAMMYVRMNPTSQHVSSTCAPCLKIRPPQRDSLHQRGFPQPTRI
jgi:hypothetical protein